MARSPHPSDGGTSVTAPLLEVRHLGVAFHTERGTVQAVDDVSFEVGEGEVLGIVGESGSGKSVTMLAIMNMVANRHTQVTGQVLYRGQDLGTLSAPEMRAVRGAEIALIFQDPVRALTPVYRVGWQIAEQIMAHEKVSRSEARDRALTLMRAVGIPAAEVRIDHYPHQFSGGMLQRVTIAMALSCRPSLLIADEPTTALDVTIQAAVLGLIGRLRRELGLSVVLITHDMGVIAEVADRVLVMYAGRVIEDAPTRQVFSAPQHPYTWGLLGAMPRLDRPRSIRMQPIPGIPPSLIDLPAGCAFQPRCSYRFAKCSERPELLDRLGDGHRDACHLDSAEKRALASRPGVAIHG
jgi:peptide/nickel transport system ATP-binding protein